MWKHCNGALERTYVLWTAQNRKSPRASLINFIFRCSIQARSRRRRLRLKLWIRVSSVTNWLECMSSIWRRSTSNKSMLCSTRWLPYLTPKVMISQRSRATCSLVSLCRALVTSRYSSMTKLDQIQAVKSSSCQLRSRKNSSSSKSGLLLPRNCRTWTCLDLLMHILKASSKVKSTARRLLLQKMMHVLLNKRYGCLFSGLFPQIVLCSSCWTRIKHMMKPSAQCSLAWREWSQVAPYQAESTSGTICMERHQAIVARSAVWWQKIRS